MKILSVLGMSLMSLAGPAVLAAEVSEGVSKVVSGGLVDPRGRRVAEDTLSGKYVALYFSASWCGPCRAFTPRLDEAYQAWIRDRQPIEVVLVSLDRTEQAMKEYHRGMPWPALRFDQTGLSQLARQFGVSGIPSLIVLDPEGKVVAANARAEVGQNGAKAVERWIPEGTPRVQTQETAPAAGSGGRPSPRWSRPPP